MLRERTKGVRRPLHDQIFEEASNFHEGAQRCLENRGGQDGRVSFPVPAYVVSLAFACELYFKALLALETGKARQGHRLNVLFAHLPDSTQALIAQRYETRRQGRAEFKVDLLTFSNAFVEWRYVYELEEASLDVVGLAQLASSLYETCVRLKPDFQQAEYEHRRLTNGLQGIPKFRTELYRDPPPWGA